MTNELANAGASQPEIKVDVGNGELLSMQTVQHLYNEITGRTEELSRSYGINHCTGIDDIRQLNIKICQMYEQYQIVSKNCAITLYHVDDQKQVFSSFERFELYDRSTLSPVENIRLEYNFLIVLPHVKKPQSYTIEINISSRAAIAERARLEASEQSDFLIRIVSERTAHLEISYIDYTVARNFQVAIDSWFKSLKHFPTLSWLKAIQLQSEHIPFVLRFISAVAFLSACVIHFSNVFSTVAPSTAELFMAGTITFGGVFLLVMVAGKGAGIATKAIRRIRPLSYLHLTRGDEIAIEKLRRENQRGWAKSIASVVSVVLINVFSSWLALTLGLTP